MRTLLVLVAVAAVGGVLGSKYYIQYKAAQDLDALLVQASPIVELRYESVVATLSGELRVEGVTVRVPQFDDALVVDAVSVVTPGFLFLLGFDSRDRQAQFPERLGIRLDGLRASLDADYMSVLDDLREAQIGALELTPADVCAGTYGFTAASLRELGYHELDVDLDVEFRRDRERLVVDIGARTESMYDFALSLTLGSIAEPMALMRGQRPQLVAGRLDYVDRSLNARVLRRCADEQVSAEEVLAAQLRELQTLARSSGMELDELIIEPYRDFLLGKQRFTLISQPPRPVDLTRISLYKPSDVPNLLNLTAEAR